MDIFSIFLANAGNRTVRRKDLKRSQLQIAYTLLYYTGLRINEIHTITEKQIIDAILSAQFNAIHYKNGKAQFHVLSKTALKLLKQLPMERIIIFQKY